MPARPQKPKPRVPPKVAKAADLASAIHDRPCRYSWPGQVRTIASATVRRRQKAAYRHLGGVICQGTLDCECDGCEFVEPSYPRRNHHRFDCDVCRDLADNRYLYRQWLKWASQVPTLDALYSTVIRTYPDTFRVRRLLDTRLKEMLYSKIGCRCDVWPSMICTCGAWDDFKNGGAHGA